MNLRLSAQIGVVVVWPLVRSVHMTRARSVTEPPLSLPNSSILDFLLDLKYQTRSDFSFVVGSFSCLQQLPQINCSAHLRI